MSRQSGGIYNTSVKKVVISEGVRSMDSSSLAFSKALETVILPETLESLNSGVFWGCSKLKSVTIGSSLTSIDGNAFGDCTSLTDIYYSGTREEWDSININSSGNDAILNATVHSSDGQEFLANGMG